MNKNTDYFKAKKERNSIFDIEIPFGRVSFTQKAIFAKHLSVMQKSGLAITESLSIIKDTTKGKMKKVVRGLLASVDAGNSLSSSVKRYPKVFGDIFFSSIYAGESSGTLDENLENLAIQMKKEKELSSKIKSAMFYPVIVLIASFILGLAMSFLVLPKIIPLFKGLKTDLPITTRWLISFSSAIENYGLIIFLGVVFSVIFIIWFLKAKFSRPFTHFLILKIPLLKKLSYNANLARFSRTLGTLLKSGLNIVEALEVTSKTLNNHYYKKSLIKTANSVSKGRKISSSLKDFSNFYPAMVTRMINVGEESGDLEEVLFYLADFYDTEVDNVTKSLSTAIEPILLLAIGLVVGFLALSIITPIYNITGNIRR